MACAEAGDIDEARQLVREMRAARRVVTQNLVNLVERRAATLEKNRGGGGDSPEGGDASESTRDPSPRPRRRADPRGNADAEDDGAGDESPTDPGKRKAGRLWSPPYSEKKFIRCVNACTNRGRRKGVIHLLRDAIENPELEFTMAMYESVLESLAKLGLPRQAVGVLGWMRETGMEPSSRCIVWAIRVCGKTSPPDAALALALLKEMDPPDVWGYAAVLSVLASGRQWKRSLALLEEMTSTGLRPNE